jgi:hypothetical protein
MKARCSVYEDNIKLDLLEIHFNSVNNIINLRVEKSSDSKTTPEPASVSFYCGTTYTIIRTVYLRSR